MKKKFLLFSLIGLVALSGCKNGGTDVTTDKEAALQRAMKPYVENTVVATYSRMADEGMKLLDKCQQILKAQEAGQDYADLMKDAGTDWRAMRKYWEKSEAGRYGAADGDKIEPQIDSWPREYNAMQALPNGYS